MLTKFISVPETRFQNTETAFKNQQASIEGLETQIGQLAKLISERAQGSLPSNTEFNPKEQLNAITSQDEEGLVTPEPEPRQETEISKGKGEVDHNEQKPVSSHFMWETKQSPFKLEIPAPHRKLKEVHEPFSSNSRGPIHEERRLQIEELDEWRTHKPRTHDKPKLRQNKLNTIPNQLKVGDKVLLDAADSHIVTTKTNEEIPLTILSIFPFSTVEDHVETGQRFSLARATINRHDRATWPWVNLPKQHGHATCPCLETVAEPVKLTRVYDMAMPSNHGRTCQNNTGVCFPTRVWEKRTEIDTVMQRAELRAHERAPQPIPLKEFLICSQSEKAPKLILAYELKTPLRKVLHDYHVLLDHDHSYHQI
ncbi:hypothetical protein GOBAR_AA19686 [Gossypium barbadense]|uniref:Uncharacterized protein n=1 Tax=Gossypium barbadense TaxID=3634 RepID=A0A2P5XCB6_GOSBA|nr:hypothetical protein GOBAR_AA19686 [Gossypium barbadense]